MNKLIKMKSLFIVGIALSMFIIGCAGEEKKEKKEEEKAAVVDKRLVNKDTIYNHFLEWLKTYEKEKNFSINTEEYSFKVIMSDLDQDGYKDGLVELNNFKPKNGKTLWNLGYVYFQNTPDGLKFIEVFNAEDDFLPTTGEVKYLSSTKGDLKFQVSRYMMNEAKCCPSLKSIEHYRIVDGKFELQEIEEDYYTDNKFKVGPVKTCVGKFTSLEMGDLYHYSFKVKGGKEMDFNNLPRYAYRMTLEDPNSDFGEKLNPKFLNREFKISYREFETTVQEEFLYPYTGITSIIMLK